MAERRGQARVGLVVEDQAATRQWMTEALRSAFGDIEVTACGTLAAAQAWIRAHPPRPKGTEPLTIALIDLVLADGSGLTLIREIADLHPDIAPVVITIYDDDAHLFEAMAAGAQGYLLKDEQPGQLVEHIHEIERGEPPLSPSVARRILAHFRDRAPEHARKGAAEVLLTTREKEVLSLIAKGLRLADAAKHLGLTRHTVAGYVKVIYSKLNISSRAEAAVEAMKRGLI